MSSLACKDPRAPLPRLFSLSFNAYVFGSGSSSYGKTRYGTSYGPWYSVPSYGSKITKVTTKTTYLTPNVTKITTYHTPKVTTKTTYHLPSTTITKYDGGFNQGAFYGDLGRK